MQQTLYTFRKAADAKLKLSLAVVFLSTLLLAQVPPGKALSSHPGPVVINEVAWAGSEDSSSDEWIELYNASDTPVDLFGWSITDSGVSTDLSGVLPAWGYFLLEDREKAVSTVPADHILKLSLKNSGDRLELLNEKGVLVDSVNSSGKSWFAGSSSPKASMERIDPLASGDLKENWHTSIGEGEKASQGSPIIGTPRRANSTPEKPGTGKAVGSAQIVLESDRNGEQEVVLRARVNEAAELFAYGLELLYDPAVLAYESSEAGIFLSESGRTRTSFQSALENGLSGKLIVAEARTEEMKSGIRGSGELFTVRFKILDSSKSATDLRFGAGSFLSTLAGNAPVDFQGQTVVLKSIPFDVPVELRAALAAERYAIRLDWNEIFGAEGYRVFRKDVKGKWTLLGEVKASPFVDGDGVRNGGDIIPFHDYTYRVVPLFHSKEGPAAERAMQETRGLKGDTTRDDRVDGRDLEKLARFFGRTLADPGFETLADTTFDGQINGSDLIDIGVHFGKTYSR